MSFLNRIAARKSIACFLLFLILNQIFTPTIAYALTAGPTAPEATNFEPIDTTDMVNPLMGTFTYNFPLLEVPGPEGSYPLSLSYHAGIQTNEEASWVGLGWSLNPGAIARNVNGYPDDWKGVTGTERDFWNGGSTTTESISVNVGLGTSPASVNFGLSFSQDTYRGFGIGASVGLGEVIQGSPFSIGVNIGVSSYGGAYAGADLSVVSGKAGTAGLKAASSIGVNTNFKSISGSADANISYSDGKSSTSMVGASMSTNNSSPTLSIGYGSVTSVTNANAGKISSRSSGFSIPVFSVGYVTVSLGYQYTRYWSDETTGFVANGVLNSRQSINQASDLSLSGDDNYMLVDPVNNNIANNPDPWEQQGGTYPNFDNYSVTAQGLGGNIRPYVFSTVLFSQNRINSNNKNTNAYGSINSTVGTVRNKWQFRFINDLSNSYRQQKNNTSGMQYDFDSAPSIGPPTSDINNDLNVGYDPNTNRLEGASHIEYFTNDQINNGQATARGFVHCPEVAGFTRQTSAVNSNVGSQIGGFMITNSSGVTYHYALPAYSFNEIDHTENISSTVNYNQLHKNAPYAYTWYLTAITGSDYVSRGSTPGLIDPSDWGYWVKFDYGRWTGSYGWRTPSQGQQRDIDNNFQTYSSGEKELYYLDAVETRTHTAIFEKEMRYDGKSNTGLMNTTTGVAPGTYTANAVTSCSGQGTVYNNPKPTMRLDNIYIFQNNQLPTDINTMRQESTTYNQTQVYNSSAQNCSAPETISEGQNVIDVNDIAALNAGLGFTSKCLRKIAFNYDYSLCPGVPNSYNPSTPSSLLGKLTLLSVDLQGVGGTPVTPPTQFQYELNSADPANNGTFYFDSVTGNKGVITINSSANQFQVGDIIYFTIGGVKYYCSLISGSGVFNVVFIGAAPTMTSGTIAAIRTKNPPYNADSYDNWGSFKSDYLPDNVNVNLARTTSAASNNATDVWSLRKIVSSLGANISVAYEGNTFARSILNKNPSVVVGGNGSTNTIVEQNTTNPQNVQNYNLSTNINSDYTIDLIAVNPQNIDLTQLFPVNSKLSGPLVFARNDNNTPAQLPAYQLVNLNGYPKCHVVSVTGNDIKIALDPALFNFLNSAPYRMTGTWNGTPPYKNANYEINYIYFTTGNLIPSGASDINYGGGTRVKNIIVDDQNGNVKQTSYSYGALNTPVNTPSSSGVTSYMPTVFDPDNLSAAINTSYINNADSAEANLFIKYRTILYNNANKLLSISREVPGPGVMYEYVTVNDYNILPNNTAIPIDGTSVYQYEVFKPEMIGIYDYYAPSATTPNSTGQTIDGHATTIVSQNKKDRSIIDFTSRIGNLKRVLTYDNYGNKLTEKINHYSYDNIDNTSFNIQNNNYANMMAANPYNSIGVIQERYAQGKYLAVNYAGYTYNNLIMISDKESYPSIQTGTTQIDYRNGTTVTQTNLAYDYFTGAVTKTLTSDAYGNKFINQVSQAYTANNGTSLIYPALGLKTFDDDPTSSGYSGQHKQMLSQQASNYTFSVDPVSNAPLGVVAATVQTWGNDVPVIDQNGASTTTGQSSIWRMKASYKWLASGTTTNNETTNSNFVDYFAPGGSSNSAWKNTAQATLYNVYSAALEGTDLNQNYGATRMGYNNSKVLITGSLSRYNEIATAGAEDALLSTGNFSNNISPGAGTVVVDSTKAHTGTNSLMVAAGQNGFTYTVPVSQLDPVKKNYSVAVWVYSTSGNVNATSLYYTSNGTTYTPSQTYSKVARNWYLLEMTVPLTSIPTSGNLVVGCKNGSSGTVYFDDFRFQPTNSSVSSFVYDNNTGDLTYIINNQNLFIRYQYDGIGRLVRTYTEVLGKSITPLTKSVNYNYARGN